MPRSLLAGLSLLLVGCFVDEENFPDKYAKVSCDKFQDCEPDDFDEYYESMAECRDDVVEVWDELEDFLGIFCDLDYDYAGKCIRDMRRASCDDYSDADWSSDACDDFMDCGWDSGWDSW